MRVFLKLVLYAVMLITASCTSEKEKKIETPVPPTNVIIVPTNMVQSPDGSLRFKSNYLQEKSDKDKNVAVTGSKLDTLK
jgi:hypothetical protein